jgi:drug/metabolite transporter (DMT)-like permease
LFSLQKVSAMSSPSPTSSSPFSGDHLLYAMVVCIWGSSWIALGGQVGSGVPILASVAYRFGLAAVLLFAWCRWRGIRLRYRLRDHVGMALQGLVLFALNYVLFYSAAHTLTSGLIAVVFSTVILFNLALGVLFLGARLESRLVIGSVLGLAGVSLVFWPEVSALIAAPSGADVAFGDRLEGIGYALAGTACASVGMTLSARNQRAGLGVMATNAWGMGSAAAALLVIAVISGTTFSFAWTVPYVGGLLYLSIISSVIAFGAYLTLVGRIGPARASYASVLFPLIALGLSTLFENYHWTWQGAAGIVFVLAGNLLVLRRPTPQAIPAPDLAPTLTPTLTPCEERAQ